MITHNTLLNTQIVIGRIILGPHQLKSGGVKASSKSEMLNMVVRHVQHNSGSIARTESFQNLNTNCALQITNFTYFIHYLEYGLLFLHSVLYMTTSPIYLELVHIFLDH